MVLVFSCLWVLGALGLDTWAGICIPFLVLQNRVFGFPMEGGEMQRPKGNLVLPFLHTWGGSSCPASPLWVVLVVLGRDSGVGYPGYHTVIGTILCSDNMHMVH